MKPSAAVGRAPAAAQSTAAPPPAQSFFAATPQPRRASAPSPSTTGLPQRQGGQYGSLPHTPAPAPTMDIDIWRDDVFDTPLLPRAPSPAPFPDDLISTLFPSLAAHPAHSSSSSSSSVASSSTSTSSRQIRVPNDFGEDAFLTPIFCNGSDVPVYSTVLVQFMEKLSVDGNGNVLAMISDGFTIITAKIKSAYSFYFTYVSFILFFAIHDLITLKYFCHNF